MNTAERRTLTVGTLHTTLSGTLDYIRHCVRRISPNALLPEDWT